VLRFVTQDGKSYGGFQNPLSVGESVTAPDWNPSNKCVGGIHGWPLGLGIGEGKEADWGALWQVYGAKPEDVVGELEGGQKCKFRAGILRFSGPWYKATEYVLNAQILWVQYNASGSASATGWSGSASATGERGSASATGARGSASATLAAQVTGLEGKAKAGKYGCIALAWWNPKRKHVEMHCALVGPGRLKPDTWYTLNAEGKFVEVL